MASYEPLNPGDKVSARWAYEELRRIAAVLDELEAADTATEAAVDALETLVPPTIWLPATSFFAIVGAPALGIVGGGRRVAMLFDSASTETIDCPCSVPVGWTSFDVEIYWINAGAGAGNVVWRVQGFEAAEGTSINAVDTENLTDFTDTAGAQDVLVRTPCGSWSALAAGNYISVRAARFGAAAGDTLGNDAGLLGVKLTKSN